MRGLLWLLVGCGPVDVDRGPGDWEPRTALPEALQENAVVALDGEVVVVGGIAPSSPASPRVEAYDPMTDRWRSLPDLPEGRHHVHAAVVDGELYALGGLDAAFGPLGDGWVLRGGAWKAVAPMPAGRERGAGIVAVLNGRIHVVGGVAGSDVAWHDVYDPSADAWASLDDAPVARDHGGGAVIDGVLYAVGGRHRSIEAHLGDLLAFDGESWSARTPLPTTRGGIAVATLEGRLHVIGGEGAPDNSGVFDVHEVWDPLTDRWTELDPPGVPRHGTGAVAIDGALYLPGGADVQGVGPIDAHEVFLP